MIHCQRSFQAPYKYNEGELCNAVLQRNWFNYAIKGCIIYPAKYLIGQLQMHNWVIECKRIFRRKHRGSAEFEHLSENKMPGTEFPLLNPKTSSSNLKNWEKPKPFDNAQTWLNVWQTFFF